MNKTVNINLGGMFFHIDEDAYQKLTRYFDAIKRSLSSSNGQEEIIKDIEMRIAELVTEKHASDKQVINIKEVDEIIAVMGQPEDYRIEDEAADNTNATFNAAKSNKKLYRDKEKGMIGGVATGLGHYFGIDPVWLRVMFLIFVFAGFGTGILAYIILWIVTPEAVTTSEKLEMTGEPVTISNIERKVREEFDSVSEKFKNANYDKMGHQVKTGAEKIFGSLGDVIMSIFRVFAKFLGVILIIASIVTLILLFIGVFTLGSTSVIELPWQDFIAAGNFTEYPIWVFGVLMFIAVGIPFFFLLLLGFKLLTPKIKSIGNVAKYTLLALWIITIGILISIGIKQASAFAVEGRVVDKKENIQLAPIDTLLIKFRHNDYFAKNVNERHDFIVTQDSAGNNIIYSNKVRFSIVKTDAKTPYIQVEKEANGKSLSEAKKIAENIRYSYKIVGKQIILDNFLLTDTKNKYRDQKVSIKIYLPVGTHLKADASARDYDESDNSYFNLHHSSDSYVYNVENGQVKCLNCPSENEYNDEAATTEEDSLTDGVIINKNGILIKSKNGDGATKKVKSVRINQDGVNIKTK